jgi:hypothetical protein
MFCLLFTCAETLLDSWPPSWFLNIILEDQGLHFVWPLTFDLVALPGAYSPTSIALRTVGARRPPLNIKVVVLEETLYILLHLFLYCYFSFLFLLYLNFPCNSKALPATDLEDP